MSELVQLCVLRVGAETYAVDLKRVEEILPVPVVTPMPKAPAFLEGVVQLRGEMLPVATTASGRAKRVDRLVVCKVGSRRVGLLVDGVVQVRRVDRSALKPAPLASEHVLGVLEQGGGLTLLLDVKALLTGEVAA